MLAGCGGSSSFAVGPTAPTAQLGIHGIGGAISVAAYPPRNRFLARPSYLRPWISPDAKRSHQIFFESDVDYQSVELFSLPGLKLEGVVTGFDQPEGMCSDANGNVWVMNSTHIVELSHTGKVLQSIDDPGFSAGCAVNPANGDLAVANLLGTSYAGSVLIYKHATGNPTMLSCESLAKYYFIGYDNHGILYVDGRDYSAQFHLCSGKDTDTSLSPIPIKGAQIYFPGMVQWYTPGKYPALGDQWCGNVLQSCIYKVSISGHAGKIIGSTRLLNYSGDPVCDLVQGVIGPGRGISILGGDSAGGCASDTSSVNVWAYPAGGIPAKYYDDPSYIDEPIGAAISTKP
jgi:sRNA-binding regulator protein Hfq